MFDVFRSKMRVKNVRITKNVTSTKYRVQMSGLFRTWSTQVDKNFTTANGDINSIDKAREFKASLIQKIKEESWESMGEHEVE